MSPLRNILAAHGRLAVPAGQLSGDADLFAAGLDSMGMVNVMLAIEGEFDVEFPDRLLARTSFSSIDSLQAIVDGLREMA